jgi:predicted enzyme related to lactoylglutathione lyase
MIENGTFFWNQLVTADQKKSGDFYCGLLGWNRKSMPDCSASIRYSNRPEKTSPE